MVPNHRLNKICVSKLLQIYFKTAVCVCRHTGYHHEDLSYSAFSALSGETVAIVTAPEIILYLSDKELICGSIVYMINTNVAILIIRNKFKLVYIDIY